MGISAGASLRITGIFRPVVRGYKTRPDEMRRIGRDQRSFTTQPLRHKQIGLYPIPGQRPTAKPACRCRLPSAGEHGRSAGAGFRG